MQDLLRDVSGLQLDDLQTYCCSRHLSSMDIYAKFANLRDNHNNAKFWLLLHKGVYLYEYMDSRDRLTETQLPLISVVHSSFNSSDISPADYAHAQRVWDKFNIHNMGEYHDLYLMTDTLLLATVFESFRSFCLDAYSLDPAHFYTSPGLAWQAALRSTKVKLELLPDTDMFLCSRKESEEDWFKQFITWPELIIHMWDPIMTHLFQPHI